MWLAIKYIFLSFVLCMTAMLTFGQSKMIYTIEGTIIFPVGDSVPPEIADSIPQDIILIPCHPSNLSDNLLGHWLYFQGIRWTQRSLRFDVTNCKRVVIKVNGLVNPRISFFKAGENTFEMMYGRITLDKDRIEDIDRDQKEYLIRITVDGIDYEIRYRDEPRSFGLPKGFECLDW